MPTTPPKVRHGADGEIEALAARRDDDRLAKAEKAQEGRDLQLVGYLRWAHETGQNQLSDDKQRNHKSEKHGNPHRRIHGTPFL